MYLKNLHNTTGILPVTINRFKSLHFFTDSKFSIKNFNKGSRFFIAAFLLLAVLTASGCDSPGSVGEEIISGSDGVEAVTYPVDNFTILEENTFSGRLPNTPLGFVEDPVYGTIKSTALLKPGLSRALVDTIRENDSVYLMLIFDERIYGNSSSVSKFTIYEANEIWRGNQLRYNQEVEVNFSRQIGEFELADEDSLLIELDDMWLQEYIEFFNSSSANRDSLYRNTTKGLAIVPSESNQKIRFLRHLGEEGDAITTLLVESPEDPDDNGNGNGDDDDDENGNGDDEDENGDDEDEESPRFIDLRDWGASFTRTVQTESNGELVLHNSERIMKFVPDLPVKELSSKNIVNAQLILSKDTSREEIYPSFTRPGTTQLRAHVFSEEPADLSGEIFTLDLDFAALIDEDEDTFKINITEFVLDEVFGDNKGKALYFTIQSVNGIIFTSRFYDHTGPENKKPRLVITSVR